MGRAKLRLELIHKETTRAATYKQRKASLIKKAYEFTTLCDVSTCMIIYSPFSDVPEVWPLDDPEKVKCVLNAYKKKTGSHGLHSVSSGNQGSSLNDFLEDKKKKVEEELAKARKQNVEAKYPTWFDFLDNYSESQLREFASVLESKAGEAKSRLEFMKGNISSTSTTPTQNSYINLCPSTSTEVQGQNSNYALPMNVNPAMMMGMAPYPSDHDGFASHGGANLMPQFAWGPILANPQQCLLDSTITDMLYANYYNNPINTPWPMSFYAPPSTFQTMMPPMMLMPGAGHPCSQLINENATLDE